MDVNSIDPDQLADLDLHCFHKRATNFEKLLSNCLHLLPVDDTIIQAKHSDIF